MATHPALLERIASAEGKIKRAFQRIDELKTLINDASCVSLKHINLESGDGATLLGFEVHTEEISTSIGEIAFLLRSALDQTWAGLEIAAGNKSPRGKHFPVRKWRKDVIEALNKGPVKDAIPQATSFILDKVKPHFDSGSNGYIWIINELCNIDKHDISIVPTYTVSKSDFTVKAGGMNIQFSGNNFGGSNPIIKSYVPIEYEEIRQGQASFNFSSDTLVVGGKPILETVANLAEATRKVLNLFKIYFS